MAASDMEIELRNRITKHLAHRENGDVCNLIWAGYLAACLEWGHLTPNEHARLIDLLKNVGHDELKEVFLGVDEAQSPS